MDGQRGRHHPLPPGHTHWHGATPTTSMPHIAVQESLDGEAVHWREKVIDEEYFAGPTLL